MNKRGQFYIIAAILIVLVLSTLTTITNYPVIKPESRFIPELSSDLNREGFMVIDYGKYTSKNKNDFNSLMTNFVGNDLGDYFLKNTDNSNIIFIYGDKKGNLKAIKYDEDKTGGISFGGVINWDTQGNNYMIGNPVTKNSNGKEYVEVTFGEKTYSFDLVDNEMFYFVIANVNGDEIFMDQSKIKKPGKNANY